MSEKKPADNQPPRSDEPYSTYTGATPAAESELALLRARVAALEALVASNRSAAQSDDDRSSHRSTTSRRRSRRRTRSARDYNDDPAASTRLDDRSSSEETDDRSSSKRVNDSFRDLSGRSMDEGNKVFRAMAMAWIEQLRTAADAVASMAEEVNDRNRAENRDSFSDMMMTLPRDIFSGFINAMDRSMDMPANAIDRYNESYDEADELLDNEDRDDSSSRRTRSGRFRAGSRDDRDYRRSTATS